ncbi:hypothetical protein D3C75_1171830 [compost metagenome]
MSTMTKGKTLLRRFQLDQYALPHRQRLAIKPRSLSRKPAGSMDRRSLLQHRQDQRFCRLMALICQQQCLAD